MIYNVDDEFQTAAREAVRKNIVHLNKAVSLSFENVILACEEKELIVSSFRQQLIHTPHKTRCIEFIDCIHNTVGLNPAHLDTFLSILHDGGPATSEVAKSVAKSCKFTLLHVWMYDVTLDGYNLPKYESIRAVGGATSVVSSDGNDMISYNEHYTIVH